MSQISGVNRSSPSENIDINCDAAGNLFVNNSPTNAVSQGDLYLDGSVISPLIPSSGPLLFGVDPSNVIQPLEITADGELKVQAEITSPDFVDPILQGDTVDGTTEGILGFGEVTSTGLAYNFQLDDDYHLFVDIDQNIVDPITTGDAITGTTEGLLTFAEDPSGNATPIAVNADGELSVTTGDSVEDGDDFLDEGEADPTDGILQMAVDPSDKIRPLRVNAVEELIVDTNLVVEDGDAFLDGTNPDPTNGVMTYGVNPSDVIKPLTLDENNNLQVSPTRFFPPLPPSGTANEKELYVKYFGTAGASLTPVSLKVDGSVTPVEFEVNAEAGGDLYITKIQFLIVDGNVSLNKFGALAELPNGVDLEITQNGSTISIVSGASTSGEIITQTDALSLFGDSNTINIMSNYSSNQDALFVTINLGEFSEGGFRIGQGNAENIKIVINDDLTDLTEFTLRAIGYKVIA